MWEESIDDPIRAGGTKRMRILLPAFVVLCVWVAATEADNVPQIPRIDGRLEAERTNLDWRGSYDRHGIN